MASTIKHLPDEVLSQILVLLAPLDAIRIQHLSRRFCKLAIEPLLWRYHCMHHFQYWDSKHRIEHKFSGSVGDVNWKELYASRCRADTQAIEILDSILNSQIGRIRKFEQITLLGYDAKDALVRQSHTIQEQDGLARRYYANAVLDLLHRSKALELWWEVGIGGAIPLERALGAFDLFILHDQHGDLDEISRLVDDLSEQLRSEMPEFEAMSTREKALRAATFLREHNLTGLASDEQYRDLQNNYIGMALQDDQHPSLPLISVSIFCALATRLGLDARCSAIPGHVHAIVQAKPHENLDGHTVEDIEPRECMYLDPYRSHLEVPMHDLQRLLLSWGVERDHMSQFLTAAATGSIVVRTSRNILSTVQAFREQSLRQFGNHIPSIKLHANPYADLDSAVYSALWANYMLSNAGLRSDVRVQREFIPLIMERFERHYPVDASLVSKFVVQTAPSANAVQIHQVRDKVRLIYERDSTPKQVQSRRCVAETESVKYKVGQVFHHKRYDYIAVIIGWDPKCALGDNWIAMNGVDALPGGRHQTFYHALVEDTSTRYVAEENIEIMTPVEPQSLMSLAGQYFKRWDPRQHVFVSNIRDEYPDD